MSDVRFSLLVLRSTDPDRSRAFYEALGLVFTEEQHGSGPAHLAAVLGDGVVMEIYPTADGGPVGRGSLADLRVGLAVKDVAVAVTAVEANGGTVASAPAAQTNGIVAVVVDPDGLRVEVTELA